MSAPNVASDPQDRRSSPRVPLDAPYFVTISLGKENDAPALLLDLSLGGAQLAFSPAAFKVTGWLGQQVRIRGLPGNIDTGALGLPGTLSWISEERCGLRFDTPLPLSEEALEDIVADL